MSSRLRKPSVHLSITFSPRQSYWGVIAEVKKPSKKAWMAFISSSTVCCFTLLRLITHLTMYAGFLYLISKCVGENGDPEKGNVPSRFEKSLYEKEEIEEASFTCLPPNPALSGAACSILKQPGEWLYHLFFNCKKANEFPLKRTGSVHHSAGVIFVRKTNYAARRS